MCDCSGRAAAIDHCGIGSAAVNQEEAEEKTTAPASSNSGSSFASDVAKLVSGTTLAQALSLLVAPILSRLYIPEEYGTATVFASVIAILGVVACLRLEQAIMLPKSAEDAGDLLAAALLSTLVISGLTIVLVLVVGESFLTLLHTPQLALYLWLFPVAVLFKGAFLALSYWHSRMKRFGLLSLVQILQSTSINGLQVGVGAAGFAQAGSLVGSRVLGLMIATAALAGKTWRDDGRMLHQSVRWSRLISAVKRYRKFPLFSTWSALLNSISWQLPTFLLSAFFSSTIVGWYALGTRVLRLPMSLIGDAIGRVFFQRAAQARVDGTLSVVVEAAFQRLVTLGMFPLLLLTFTGREIFVVIFGENWSEAGVYAQILSPWTFFWFVSSPLSTLFSVLERQEFSLAINVVIIVTRILSLWVGSLLDSARLGLILFGVSGVIVYGYLAMSIMAASGVPWRRATGILLTNVARFVPAGAVVLILKALRVHPWLQVIASGLLLGIYLLLVLRADPQLYQILGQLEPLKKLGSLRRVSKPKSDPASGTSH